MVGGEVLSGRVGVPCLGVGVRAMGVGVGGCARARVARRCWSGSGGLASVLADDPTMHLLAGACGLHGFAVSVCELLYHGTCC